MGSLGALAVPENSAETEPPVAAEKEDLGVLIEQQLGLVEQQLGLVEQQLDLVEQQLRKVSLDEDVVNVAGGSVSSQGSKTKTVVHEMCEGVSSVVNDDEEVRNAMESVQETKTVTENKQVTGEICESNKLHGENEEGLVEQQLGKLSLGDVEGGSVSLSFEWSKTVVVDETSVLNVVNDKEVISGGNVLESVEETKNVSEIGEDKQVTGDICESKLDGENKEGLVEEQLGKVSLHDVEGGSASLSFGGSKTVVIEISVLNVVNDKEVISGGNALESVEETKNVKEISEDKQVTGESKLDGVSGVNGTGSGEDESDSESESSGASSSSSSSSDDNEEDEVAAKKARKKGGRVEGDTDIEEGEITTSDDLSTWGDDEDYEEDMTDPFKPFEDLPPVPPVTAVLKPHHQTLPIGSVLSIVGIQVVVEGDAKHCPLSEGSILWITQSRLPLGIVDEIFGPVMYPYYIVRYNTESEVPSGIEQGTSISFVSEFADHVLNDKNIYKKGYDPSGDNDTEDEMEFSDDEKEAEYLNMLKLKKNVPRPGTRRYEKIQNFKNQKAKENRSNNETTSPQRPSRGENIFARPVSTPLNQESSSGSSNMGQGPGTNHPMVPPFPFIAPGPNFVPPHGMWGQPQGMPFPGGMPANPMPWMPPNQLFQVPLPMGMMPQQQMYPMPGFPGNFVGVQPFAPWSMGVDPNMLSQMQYGMGLQAQPNTLPVNAGQQERPTSGQQMSQNNSETSQSGGSNRGRGGGTGGPTSGQEMSQNNSEASQSGGSNRGRGGGRCGPTSGQEMSRNNSEASQSGGSNRGRGGGRCGPTSGQEMSQNNSEASQSGGSNRGRGGGRRGPTSGQEMSQNNSEASQSGVSNRGRGGGRRGPTSGQQMSQNNSEASESGGSNRGRGGGRRGPTSGQKMSNFEASQSGGSNRGRGGGRGGGYRGRGERGRN